MVVTMLTDHLSPEVGRYRIACGSPAEAGTRGPWPTEQNVGTACPLVLEPDLVLCRQRAVARKRGGTDCHAGAGRPSPGACIVPGAVLSELLAPSAALSFTTDLGGTIIPKGGNWGSEVKTLDSLPPFPSVCGRREAPRRGAPRVAGLSRSAARQQPSGTQPVRR